LSILLSFFLLSYALRHLYPHSFPTRRSSDLLKTNCRCSGRASQTLAPSARASTNLPGRPENEKPLAGGMHRRGSLIFRSFPDDPDWKSTRLNSSHGSISYAVFCLKKKIKSYNSITEKVYTHADAVDWAELLSMLFTDLCELLYQHSLKRTLMLTDLLE